MSNNMKAFANNPIAYGLIGLLIGLFNFFHPSAELSQVINANHEGAGYWYRIFSQNIFQSQNIYLAESILLPLIAKIIGANTSVINYQVFCAFITILIMPIFCLAFKNKIYSKIGVICAIALMSFTYVYLYNYELGFPDPLTIILLSLMVLSIDTRWVFITVFFASLSHFSITLLATIGYIVLYLANDHTFFNKKNIKQIVYGILLGKLFLFIWGFVFHYNLNSRINFVYEQGFDYFWQRYINNKIDFWFTPGKFFIIINLFILFYFCFIRNFKLVFAQLFTLGLAYLGLFITVDGLRVFAVIVVPSYLYLLIITINKIFLKRNLS